MNLCKWCTSWKRVVQGGAVLTLAAIVGGWGQGAGSIPIKPGLWETTVSSTNVMSLPPETEARIANMPPEQQAMIRARMGGAPATSTHKSCVATKQSMDDFLDQAKERTGMRCTFSNRQETTHGASFDTSCSTERGTMKGHSDFHMADDEHVSGTTHVEGTMNSQRGGTVTMKIESTMTSKYLGSDCGDVKPATPAAQ